MNTKTHCNQFFDAGLLTVVMDIGAGSSGKGKIGSYLAEHASNVDFAVNTFHPQAGHWVRLDDGREFFYQSLNSCAYLLGDKHRQIIQNMVEDGHDAVRPSDDGGGTPEDPPLSWNWDNDYAGEQRRAVEEGRATSLQKLYIAPGAMIELPALLREIQENGIQPHQLGISPLVPILDTEIDGGFEQGRLGFDGTYLFEKLGANWFTKNGGEEGTARFGSTGHGVGSCNARRVLRRPSLKMARDIPELAQYICDVPNEIMTRLNKGESGLLELAQGFQLSMMHPLFYPYTTSRNVTVSQGLSDCMLPPKYAGQVIGNVRCLPIRISSNKYIAKDDGRHLTWAEVQSGVPHTVYEGNSGGWYPDQVEMSWEEVTASSGSPVPIMEITSVTKLPRRVATFSRQNVEEFIRHNDTGYGVILSLNFANYVSHGLTGQRWSTPIRGGKFGQWMLEALGDDLVPMVRFVGTGAKTDDTIFIS